MVSANWGNVVGAFYGCWFVCFAAWRLLVNSVVMCAALLVCVAGGFCWLFYYGFVAMFRFVVGLRSWCCFPCWFAIGIVVS